jgi:hypothetical protein
MGLSFAIACGPRQRSHSQAESHGTHGHILLSQILDSPNLEGKVPVFISPRNGVTRLYPQALGSLFVTSYDSAGRYSTPPPHGINLKIKVKVTLRLAVLAPGPLRPTTRDFFPQLNPWGHSPYVTPSLKRRWVRLSRICMAFRQVYIENSSF